MSMGSYQRAASSNNSSSSNGGGGDGLAVPPTNTNTTSGSVRLAGDNTKDRMYEPKHHQKAVRVLTVIAYIFFVSLAAITLSLYYVFIYDPPPQPQTHHASGLQYASSSGPGANGNSYSSPIVINITDCKQVVAVAVVNRTRPTPPVEPPRVLAVGAPPPSETPVPQADWSANKTSSSGDAGRMSNSTKYGYGSDYSKGGTNDVDYYT